MPVIKWLGHASFRIQHNDIVIYIDPWKISDGEPKGDLILISHSHGDHLSIEDVEKLRRPDTTIVCSADCRGKFSGNVSSLKPGESLSVKGVTITGVRAYNRDKKYHPRTNDWLGFLINIGGECVYYAGDTDVIPEMQEMGRVDVALFPVGGLYTMTAAEAAEAAKLIEPKRAIPYHWGDIIGTSADAEKFKELCQCEVEILLPQS